MKIYSGLKAYIYEGISHRVPTIELFLAILVLGRPIAVPNIQIFFNFQNYSSLSCIIVTTVHSNSL